MLASSRKEALKDELLDVTLMAIDALTTTLRRSFDKRYRYIKDIPEGVRGALELRRYYLDRLIQDGYPEINEEDKKKIVNCIEQLIQKYRYALDNSDFSRLPPEVLMDMDHYGAVNPSTNRMYYDRGRQQWVDSFVKKYHHRNKIVNKRIKLALLLGLITPEQFLKMPLSKIEYLFTNKYGIQALREGLITSEQIVKMSPSMVQYLFNNEYCIQALREGLITLEQIAAMPDDKYARNLFLTEHGITALREGLITPEQIAAMPHNTHIYHLFKNKKGIQKLRQGLITPEQVAKMKSNDLIIKFL
jgi:hypothetical protein